MVFQSYALYPHMTVLDNMAFALKLAKRPKAEIEKKVNGPQTSSASCPSSSASRRTFRRAAAARRHGTRHRAEPEGFPVRRATLQPGREAARADARRGGAILHSLNTTTVYVTHDQTEAMTLGDRVAIMLHGELQQVASPMELYNSPQNLFVAGFIGSPGMNFLPATIDGGMAKLPMVDVKLPPELPSGSAASSRAGS